MKKFGEFLVEQNSISGINLLDACSSQILSIPTTAEIVRKQQLLSVEDQLKVVSKHVLSGGNYRQAKQALGFWTEEIALTIQTEVAKYRKPLGQFLCEAGHLTFSDLAKILDDFAFEAES